MVDDQRVLGRELVVRLGSAAVLRLFEHLRQFGLGSSNRQQVVPQAFVLRARDGLDTGDDLLDVEVEDLTLLASPFARALRLT